MRAAGVEGWLDQNELTGGDAWDAKIRPQIAECAPYGPIISANTQARHEGCFRLEWKLAARRTHLMSGVKAFLLPVVIDATRDAETHVPEEFRAVQWTRLPGGEANEAFVARVRHLLGSSRMEPGHPRPGQRGAGAASPTHAPLPPPATRRARWFALFSVGHIAFAVALALWQPWQSRTPTASEFPAARAVSDKSIAVLPFVNQSEDKENTAFFADSMHEDILTQLANIPDLRVISRTSVMEYRNTSKKIPEVARAQGPRCPQGPRCQVLTLDSNRSPTARPAELSIQRRAS